MTHRWEPTYSVIPEGVPGHPSGRAGRNLAYRVIRRQPRPTRVIQAPGPEEPEEAPTTRYHARRFVAALIGIIVLGAILLSMPWASESGERTPAVDAFFTAVSAVCVTGLVTVDTEDHWSLFGEVVILTLIQIGGLGFMVGASILLQLLRRGSTLRGALLLRDGQPTLSLREATDLSGQIIRFTFVVEAIGAVLLAGNFWLYDGLPLGRSVWYGLFHAVSSFCNAGFDLFGGFRSYSGYATNVFVNVVIILLIQAGALSYIVYRDVWTQRRWARFSVDTKLVLVVNATLLLLGVVLMLVIEWNRALAGLPEWAKPMGALFQSVSARTAGAATINYGEVSVAVLFFWVALMAIGGASGSTAGGMKLSTVGVLVVGMMTAIRGEEDPQVFRRRLSPNLIFRAMAVAGSFFIAHFVLTAFLAIIEDWAGGMSYSLEELMFEAMSALATVGLSTGLTPFLSSAGKLVLCVAMFVGRIGPLTLAYALQRRQRRVTYRFPEAGVRIG